MLTLFLTIILLHLCSSFNSGLMVKSGVDCIESSEVFWLVFQRHFSKTKFLTIKLLNGFERDDDVQHTANIIMRKAWEDYYITKVHNLFREKTSGIPEKKDLSDWENHGYIIVVRNEKILRKFLNEQPLLIAPKSRSIYMVLFLHSITECGSSRFGEILSRFWRQHNIMHLIALTQCSCVYSYRPFQRINESNWGELTSCRMENFDKTHYSNLNFNQHPLRVSMFVRPPTALTALPWSLSTNRDLTHSGGFGGLDGWMLGGMAQYLNFTVEIIPTDNFGVVLPNGSATASLGDVAYRRADFAGNGRFLTQYGTEAVDFTIPYGSDYICAIAAKAPQVPQWKKLFNSLDKSTWGAFMALMVIGAACWRFARPERRCLCREIVAVFLGIPVKPPPSLLLAVFMIFNVIMNGVLQGSLSTAFTTITYYDDIKTLQQLDASGLPIASSLISFNTDPSELMESLRRKRVASSDYVFDRIASGEKVATLGRKNDVDYYIKINYLGDDGNPLLHVVDECITFYFIAFIVPSDSPFLTIFNEIIVRFIQGGFVSKWYQDIIDSLILQKLVNFRTAERKPFTLYDIQLAFHILILGILLSVLAFIGEIITQKTQSPKKALGTIQHGV